MTILHSLRILTLSSFFVIKRKRLSGVPGGTPARCELPTREQIAGEEEKGRGERAEGPYPIKSFHAEAAPGEMMRGVPSEVEREFVHLGGCLGVHQGRNEMAALVVVFRFDVAEAARALSRPPAMLPTRAGVADASRLARW